jgi:hypothetical protein
MRMYLQLSQIGTRFLHFAAVAHVGNSQSSAAEGNAILDAYRSLIGQIYQSRW